MGRIWVQIWVWILDLLLHHVTLHIFDHPSQQESYLPHKLLGGLSEIFYIYCLPQCRGFKMSIPSFLLCLVIIVPRESSSKGWEYQFFIYFIYHSAGGSARLRKLFLLNCSCFATSGNPIFLIFVLSSLIPLEYSSCGLSSHFIFWFHIIELSSVVWSDVSFAGHDYGFITLPLTHFLNCLKLSCVPWPSVPLLHVSVHQAGKHFSACQGKKYIFCKFVDSDYVKVMCVTQPR